MKLFYLAAALAAVLASPVMAAGSEPMSAEPLSIQEVSQLTGVKQSSLRVLFGARTSPGIYPLNYSIAKRDYREAIQRLRDNGVAVSVGDDGVQFVRIASQAPETRVENVL